MRSLFFSVFKPTQSWSCKLHFGVWSPFSPETMPHRRSAVPCCLEVIKMSNLFTTWLNGDNMDLFPKETQNDVLKNVDKNASDSYSSLYFQITSQELNSQLALRHILHAEFCLTFETYFLLSMDTITPRRLSSLLDRTGNCQTLNRQRRRIPLGKGVKSVCVCVCVWTPPASLLFLLCVGQWMYVW